jgi:carboxypeptidase Taq
MSSQIYYAELTGELKRLHRLSSLQSLLGWDEQVNLPPKSSDFRADQSSVLARVLHQEMSRPELGDMISRLEAVNDLSPAEALVVREARREYDKATRLPGEFVGRRTAAHSKAFHAWAGARKKNDFAAYVPFLEENLKLAKEEVGYLDWNGNAYDYWVDTFDPGMSAERIDELFAELSRDLVPLAADLWDRAEGKQIPDLKGFPESDQEAFLKDVVRSLGFDFDRGRIDRSLHPFCSGSGQDIRMTTRFHEDVPLDSLFSSIHETGHGMYEQGLPSEQAGNALGDNAGMGVHESQSRLYENQVGRSLPFWKYWGPRFRERFAAQLKGVSDEALYLAINAVGKNPIRVDADEVSYNLHIILRFRLEKALFSGDLAVADLPAAWNELSRELLHLDPPSDARGVLQDVHWSGGAFGYFPSYCLGNMLAAQLWEAYRAEHPDWERSFAAGQYGDLLEWLRAKVHQKGRQVNLLTLPRQELGQELSPAALIRHLNERYSPLYS